MVPKGVKEYEVINKNLPLLEVRYVGHVEDSIAKIELTQLYENISDETIDI